MRQVLILISIFFLTFSCSAQKEVAFVDYEYTLKDSIAFKYIFFNALKYESLKKIEGGFVHLGLEINKKGKVLSVENLRYRIFPESYVISIQEQEKLILLTKKYADFHNPTHKNTKFGYVISLSKILR